MAIDTNSPEYQFEHKFDNLMQDSSQTGIGSPVSDGNTLGANVGGTIGSILGELGAGALDVGTLGAAAPLVNPITGGALGGALGGAGGQVIGNLLGGQNVMSGVAPAMAQQAAWGAIPGMGEAKLGAKLAEKPLMGMLAKPLMRAGAGFIGGGGAKIAQNVADNQPLLQDVLQQGGQVAGINAVLPGMGNIVGKGLGMTALGKGGAKLAELNKMAEKPIVGTVEKIANNIYNWTAPIRTQLASLLDSSGKTISKGELFQALEDAAKHVGGLSEKADVEKYVKNQQNMIDQWLTEHLQQPQGHGVGSAPWEVSQYGQDRPDFTGGTGRGGPLPSHNELMKKRFAFQLPTTGQIAPIGQKVGNIVQGFQKEFNKGADILTKVRDPNTQLPLSFAQFIATKLDKDVGSKWEKIMNGKYVGHEERINAGASAKIKQLIGEKSGNPKEYKRLRGLIQSSHDIYSHVRKQQYQGLKSLGGIAKIGPGAIGAIFSILHGNIPGALLGAGAAMAGSAIPAEPLATGAASILQSPIGQSLMQSLSRVGGTPLLYTPSSQNQGQ